MKNIALTIFLVALLCFSANAQTTPSGFTRQKVQAGNVAFTVMLFPSEYATAEKASDGLDRAMIEEFGCRSFNQCHPVFEQQTVRLESGERRQAIVLYLKDETVFIFLFRTQKTLGLMYISQDASEEDTSALPVQTLPKF